MSRVTRSRRYRLPGLVATLLLLASLLAVAPPAAFAAGTSEVTNCADTVLPATAGSLRAAVEAANADGTATALDPHVITFSLACATITLAGTQLAITNHVDIQGPGANLLTVDGNNASRVFEVAAGVTATISGLTISGGNGGAIGGGILNRGTLTVTNSTISGNTADSSGGGIIIAPGGTLTVTSSTLSGNTADFGGGIYNFSGTLTVTVTSSTLSGNTADSRGGGIMNPVGPLTVTSSTLSGNTAGFDGGGIFNGDFGTLTVTNSTLSGNTANRVGDPGGGGISNVGDATLEGTLLAGNPSGGNCAEDAVVSDGYNLSDDDTCGLSATGDLDDNPNANLGPLQDNGGPTETHALQSPSSAIDVIPPDGSAGCGTTILTDQRGEPRPVGTNCDIGAYESDTLLVQTYFQACLYAGSLSKVSSIGDSTTTTVNCGRGTAIVLEEGDDYHACLYAGSLSQVGTNEPSSCGRGTPISLAAGTDLWACLYAGLLSRVGTSQAPCSRGELIGLDRGDV